MLRPAQADFNWNFEPTGVPEITSSFATEPGIGHKVNRM
jgi:hypothetical protein